MSNGFIEGVTGVVSERRVDVLDASVCPRDENGLANLFDGVQEPLPLCLRVFELGDVTAGEEERSVLNGDTFDVDEQVPLVPVSVRDGTLEVVKLAILVEGIERHQASVHQRPDVFCCFNFAGFSAKDTVRAGADVGECPLVVYDKHPVDDAGQRDPVASFAGTQLFGAGDHELFDGTLLMDQGSMDTAESDKSDAYAKDDGEGHGVDGAAEWSECPPYIRIACGCQDVTQHVSERAGDGEEEDGVCEQGDVACHPALVFSGCPRVGHQRAPHGEPQDRERSQDIYQDDWKPRQRHRCRLHLRSAKIRKTNPGTSQR